MPASRSTRERPLLVPVYPPGPEGWLGFSLSRLTAVATLSLGTLVSTGGAMPASAQEGSGLEGAWELVRGRCGLPAAPVGVHTPDWPVQSKLLVSGCFACVRQEAGGPFKAASAGHYAVERDTTAAGSLP